jgi:O-antigen/teichoic acid export membrane protein
VRHRDAADSVSVAVNNLVEGQDAGSSARRVARNTVVRGFGEVVGKLATFVLFVVVARQLGPQSLGDITFAVALTGNLLVISAFGVDAVVTREGIRRPSLLGSLMGNALVIKLVTSVPALLIAAIVIAFGNYSHDAKIATLLIGISTLVDTLENTWNAAFQAYERLEFVSAIVMFQRVMTGVLTIAVVLAGGGVISVSGTFLVVSVATILLAMWLLRFVASPTWSVQRARLVPLLRTGFPIGIAILLLTVLLRIDTILLSLIAGNEEVGIYGAAFRIFESTMFLSWAFQSAIFPWFSRTHLESDEKVARGYEVGLSVILSLLTPVGIACFLLAGPIVHVLYGSRYDASITPLRLMGVVVIAYGVNTLTSSTLAAKDRPRLMHGILLVTVVQNIVMNVVLIPPYGATGAALTAAVSGVLLGGLSIRQATKTLGRVRLTRIFLAPFVGAVAMSIAILPVWGSLVGGLLLGGAAYFLTFVVVERTFFPEDFSLFLASIRLRTRSA